MKQQADDKAATAAGAAVRVSLLVISMFCDAI